MKAIDNDDLKHRERAFLIGAPLAVVPALCFLPAVTFLAVFPRIAHGRIVAAFALPLCMFAGGVGLWKLAVGAVQKPWGILNVLSFGAVVVVLFISGYTGLFLGLMTLKM